MGVKVPAGCLVYNLNRTDWGGSQVAKATDCKSVTRGFDSHSPLAKNAGYPEKVTSVFLLGHLKGHLLRWACSPMLGNCQ